MDREEHFVCACHHPEHQFFVSFYDKEFDERGVMYISPHLAQDPWWRRLITGIKYIFGHRSRYGAFDEIILEGDDILRLHSIIEDGMKEFGLK